MDSIIRLQILFFSNLIIEKHPWFRCYPWENLARIYKNSSRLIFAQCYVRHQLVELQHGASIDPKIGQKSCIPDNPVIIQGGSAWEQLIPVTSPFLGASLISAHSEHSFFLFFTLWNPLVKHLCHLQPKLTPQERLKLRMQKALNKQCEWPWIFKPCKSPKRKLFFPL